MPSSPTLKPEFTQATITLALVIQDCGGHAAVARALDLQRASVWEWANRGRLPWTELDGRTAYSSVLAGMQRTGTLTAEQIRVLGTNINTER